MRDARPEADDWCGRYVFLSLRGFHEPRSRPRRSRYTSSSSASSTGISSGAEPTVESELEPEGHDDGGYSCGDRFLPEEVTGVAECGSEDGGGEHCCDEV